MLSLKTDTPCAQINEWSWLRREDTFVFLCLFQVAKRQSASTRVMTYLKADPLLGRSVNSCSVSSVPGSVLGRRETTLKKIHPVLALVAFTVQGV